MECFGFIIPNVKPAQAKSIYKICDGFYYYIHAHSRMETSVPVGQIVTHTVPHNIMPLLNFVVSHFKKTKLNF